MFASNNTTTAIPFNDVTAKATFGLAALLVFVIVAIIVVAVRKKCRKNRSPSPSEADEEDGSPPPENEIASTGYERAVFVPGPIANAKSNHLADDIKCMLSGHVIERQRIRLGHVIGKGEFGCVYEALLLPVDTDNGDYCLMSSQKVAVKTLKEPTGNVESFLKEGMIMKNFDHRNVLSLIGVAIDDASRVPLIVLPFMANGCLKKYIMHSSLIFTVRDLLSFGHQVAEGMRYLSGLKFVHRDLATRNCMLDGNLQLKIADFGLSRDLFSRDYYSSGDRNAKVPVRWMAVESLTSARYTTKSDVWSFGILLWELLTRGSLPYYEISNWDVQPYVLSGQRLAKPEACPDEVYQLMQQCWSKESTDRPSFDEICELFDSILHGDMITDESDHDYINLTSNVDVQHQEDSGSHVENTSSSTGLSST